MLTTTKTIAIAAFIAITTASAFAGEDYPNPAATVFMQNDVQPAYARAQQNATAVQRKPAVRVKEFTPTEKFWFDRASQLWN